MIPISDDNPRHKPSYMVIAIIAVCVVVSLYTFSIPPSGLERFFKAYGFMPAVLTGNVRSEVSPFVAIFTSMFLHSGLFHLAGNMLYLWIFGDNIEAAMGHLRFVMFYLVCGIVAAFAQFSINPASEIPMVGASGAISGILGAYLMLFPKANIKVILFLFFYVTIVNIPAYLMLGLWFLQDLFGGLATLSREGGGVAFWAHIGGFITGMILVKFFIKEKEHLFHGRHTSPWKSRKIVDKRKNNEGSQGGPWG